jgi:predicted glycosyltransferase
MRLRLLFYCQHSLGLGHFVRSLTLAEALADSFEVVFFNGGPVPMAMELPAGIRFVHLPPLRMEADGSLSGDGTVEDIFARRSAVMMAVAAERPCAAVVVELYPFGRKKFAVEIEPLIAEVRQHGGKVLCSVRDILVNQRVDQTRHDQRAADRLNHSFDAVLVHADPQVSRFEDCFQPSEPIAIPVRHTGFVTRGTAPGSNTADAPTLVTAGSGVVGKALYAAALDAQHRLWQERGWHMTVLAGPLLPEDDWTELCDAARNVPQVTLVRAVPSLAPLLGTAGRVVSQCGYNSALEILGSGLPVLFVPFARGQESEQTMRAQLFADLGLAQWLAEDSLTGDVLADRLLTLGRSCASSGLDTGGAATSARIVTEMLA